MTIVVTKNDLIAFENEVAEAFEAKLIPGPIHLSGGNEDQLIEIFKNIKPTDWVFSTWRSHYHALLHGVPRETVMAEIMAGRSMSLMFPEHNFFTSAIVGGILPIAVGVAYALKGTDTKVWCFVGDMAATTGMYAESYRYATRCNLPIIFVMEDNGLSCNTPTDAAWGDTEIWPIDNEIDYPYSRKVPHCGTGKWVTF
ncbi:MAG: thiamine pyrophosphate-dependent enzyme [Candidatus Berkelbacteria bacterium]|nr:thiamine pyrophosphate-dependent enzyme [Candidatus Berkelbacteria bacterium]